MSASYRDTAHTTRPLGLSSYDCEYQSLLDDQLHYYAQLFEPQLADRLYADLCHEVAWQSSQIFIYGEQHAIPRLESWHGDPQARYQYSGKSLLPKPWTPTLMQLKDWLNAHFKTQFNSVLCNLYRDGNDRMGWHSDDELELGNAPRIMSLSLGAERDFAVRRIGSSKQTGTLLLNHGSLLDMRPGMQAQWQHSIPMRKKVTRARINLTFREILF